jgi:hypothetical protein
LSPRQLAEYDGELAWPERFGRQSVKRMENTLGPYAFAGQYQQSPRPRKGGIFKLEYWQPYVVPSEGRLKGKWPEFDFVLVSVDSAFTEKEERLAIEASECPVGGDLRPRSRPAPAK